LGLFFLRSMPCLASPHYQLTLQPPAFLFFTCTCTSRSAQMAPLPLHLSFLALFISTSPSSLCLSPISPSSLCLSPYLLPRSVYLHLSFLALFISTSPSSLCLSPSPSESLPSYHIPTFVYTWSLFNCHPTGLRFLNIRRALLFLPRTQAVSIAVRILPLTHLTCTLYLRPQDQCDVLNISTELLFNTARQPRRMKF